ncbi:MAG: hypothetical protein HY814_03115 [Candidatus Riflebacteria bacterium]|nr:hypothetical protein [Candidatus Riflebacteria bacterium]
MKALAWVLVALSVPVELTAATPPSSVEKSPVATVSISKNTPPTRGASARRKAKASRAKAPVANPKSASVEAETVSGEGRSRGRDEGVSDLGSVFLERLNQLTPSGSPKRKLSAHLREMFSREAERLRDAGSTCSTGCGHSTPACCRSDCCACRRCCRPHHRHRSHDHRACDVSTTDRSGRSTAGSYSAHNHERATSDVMGLDPIRKFEDWVQTSQESLHREAAAAEDNLRRMENQSREWDLRNQQVPLERPPLPAIDLPPSTPIDAPRFDPPTFTPIEIPRFDPPTFTPIEIPRFDPPTFTPIEIPRFDPPTFTPLIP